MALLALSCPVITKRLHTLQTEVYILSSVLPKAHQKRRSTLWRDIAVKKNKDDVCILLLHACLHLCLLKSTHKTERHYRIIHTQKKLNYDGEVTKHCESRNKWATKWSHVINRALSSEVFIFNTCAR